MKTLRIPVCLNDGKWELFHGGDFPKLKDGAMADLVIETHYLQDPADISRLTHHKTVTVMTKGTTLMARVSLDYCEKQDGLIEKIKLTPLLGYPVAFVPIELMEDLTRMALF